MELHPFDIDKEGTGVGKSIQIVDVTCELSPTLPSFLPSSLGSVARPSIAHSGPLITAKKRGVSPPLSGYRIVDLGRVESFVQQIVRIHKLCCYYVGPQLYELLETSETYLQSLAEPKRLSLSSFRFPQHDECQIMRQKMKHLKVCRTGSKHPQDFLVLLTNVGPQEFDQTLSYI